MVHITREYTLIFTVHIRSNQTSRYLVFNIPICIHSRRHRWYRQSCEWFILSRWHHRNDSNGKITDILTWARHTTTVKEMIPTHSRWPAIIWIPENTCRVCRHRRVNASRDTPCSDGMHITYFVGIIRIYRSICEGNFIVQILWVTDPADTDSILRCDLFDIHGWAKYSNFVAMVLILGIQNIRMTFLCS